MNQQAVMNVVFCVLFLATVWSLRTIAKRALKAIVMAENNKREVHDLWTALRWLDTDVDKTEADVYERFNSIEDRLWDLELFQPTPTGHGMGAVKDLVKTDLDGKRKATAG